MVLAYIIAGAWLYLVLGFAMLLLLRHRLPAGASSMGAGLVILLLWPLAILQVFRARRDRKAVLRA